MPGIYFIDVTNRDGVQTANLGLSKLQKTLLNMYLNEFGVFQTEFGFPITRHESMYLQANLELARMGVLRPVRLQGWMRARADDVETSFRLVPGLQHVNMSASTSEQAVQGAFQGRLTREDTLKIMTDAVEAAKSHRVRSLGVNAADASRTDMDYLVRFSLAAKEHGAHRIRYCDTLGYDNPFTIYEAVRTLATETGMPIELHCHGDLGMAVPNSLAGAKAALDAGKDAYINTTVNGIGERAGNADLLATALAVTKSRDFRDRYRLGKKLNLRKTWKLARFASYAFGVPIPVNQPGVGANAFAHASGIHADGVIKDPENYELYDYRELGRGEPELVETGRSICSGEYSGVSGFRHLMGKMAVTFKDEEEARRIVELVRYANVEAQKPLTEDELRFISRYPDIARRILTLEPGA